MDSLQVFRLLLAVAIIHTAASSNEPTEDNLSVIPLKRSLQAENVPPTLLQNQKNTAKFREAHKRKMKEFHEGKSDGMKNKLKNKVKRQANSRRSWSGYQQYGNPPPYLVYNKKIGAYYPYYKFPIENNVRRSGARNNYNTITNSRSTSRNYLGS